MFVINAIGLYLVFRYLRRRTDEGAGAEGRERRPRDRYDPWGENDTWAERDTWAEQDAWGADESRLPPGRRGGSDALRILEERYARGEIDRDEFLRRRADIVGED